MTVGAGASRRMRAARSMLAVVAAAMGCAPAMSLPRPSPPTLAESTDLATCAAAKDPLHPMIVEWPATSRADLATAGAHGPVVVSYAGCTLKVLSGCRARGRYDEVRTTPARDEIAIEREQDLYAELPLGIASLKGHLARGKQLRLVYVAVGERVLSEPPEVLDGECDGATHYVDAMVLGAFSLETRAARSASGSVQAAGASAGAGDRASEQISGSSGDVTTCMQKGLDAGESCQGVLQLGLKPLMRSAGRRAAFGVGLETAQRIPTLSQLEPLPGATSAALGKIDVTLLELVAAAKKLDATTGAPSAAKALAWDALTRYWGENPYKERAGKRRDEWQHVAEAEATKRAQAISICPRYEEERAKLARLVQLGDDVVSASDKARYRTEFAQAYAPWPELARCVELETEAAHDAASRALGGANAGMVMVPGGTFAMGGFHDDAKPVHWATVESFAIDVTEVTVEAYDACMRAHVCTRRTATSGSERVCNGSGGRGAEAIDHMPANCANYKQAETFCRWAGKRLPTEEEWEFAARGKDRREYPWGNVKAGEYAVARCARSAHEGEVGSRPENASPFGAIDMAGSAWEWTSSHYSATYAQARTSKNMVLRGGANGTDWCADAADRLAKNPASADPFSGFRCAR